MENPVSSDDEFMSKFTINLGLFPANFVTKTLDQKTEPPKKSENKVVIKVDEALLDKTLEQVESADPSEEKDSAEMLQNEEICSKMGKQMNSAMVELFLWRITFQVLLLIRNCLKWILSSWN